MHQLGAVCSSPSIIKSCRAPRRPAPSQALPPPGLTAPLTDVTCQRSRQASQAQPTAQLAAAPARHQIRLLQQLCGQGQGAWPDVAPVGISVCQPRRRIHASHCVARSSGWGARRSAIRPHPRHTHAVACRHRAWMQGRQPERVCRCVNTLLRPGPASTLAIAVQTRGRAP